MLARRRRLVLIAAFASSAVAVAAACSFPDPSYSPDGDGGLPDTLTAADTGMPLTDTGVDGSMPDRDDVDPDGGSHEASDYDAAGKIDAAVCSTTTNCDCDGDMSNRDGGNAACAGDPGGVFDCDDSDPAIRPTADFVASTMWTSTWSPTHDWNCDGVVTKQYASNFTCGGLLSNCAAMSGFTGNPDCGETSAFITCKTVAGLTCQTDTTTMKVQACK